MMRLRRKLYVFAGLVVAVYVIVKLHSMLVLHEAQAASTKRQFESGGSRINGMSIRL